MATKRRPIWGAGGGMITPTSQAMKLPTLSLSALTRGPAAQFRPTQMAIRQPTYKAGNPGVWGTVPKPAMIPKQPNQGYVTGYQPGVATDPTHPPPGVWSGDDGSFPEPHDPWMIPGTGGGYDVYGDPEYQATLRDIAAANAADDAAARENVDALAVSWGGDLSNLVQSGLISQKVADAAKANQFSQMNEFGRALGTGSTSLQAQLASRGILSSGALVGGEEELNRQYQKETTTGLAQKMADMRNVLSQAAQAKAGRQGMATQAYGSIASRLSQDPRYQPTPTLQVFWDKSYGAYVDDWGRMYDKNRNIIGRAF